MTAYTDIFNMFLNKISDVKLMSLSDDDITEMLMRYMNSSIAKCKKCKTDLSDRDDMLQVFNNDLLDIEIEIIATGMVKEWLEPQINSTTLTNQFVGGKEEKFYAPSNLLDKLIELSNKNKLEARKLSRDYSYQSFIDTNLS